MHKGRGTINLHRGKNGQRQYFLEKFSQKCWVVFSENFQGFFSWFWLSSPNFPLLFEKIGGGGCYEKWRAVKVPRTTKNSCRSLRETVSRTANWTKLSLVTSTRGSTYSWSRKISEKHIYDSFEVITGAKTAFIASPNTESLQIDFCGPAQGSWDPAETFTW